VPGDHHAFALESAIDQLGQLVLGFGYAIKCSCTDYGHCSATSSRSIPRDLLKGPTARR
jgi:hypothetical protein